MHFLPLFLTINQSGKALRLERLSRSVGSLIEKSKSIGVNKKEQEIQLHFKYLSVPKAAQSVANTEPRKTQSLTDTIVNCVVT